MTNQTKKPETKPSDQTKKPETKTSGSFVVVRGVVKHSGRVYKVGDVIPVTDLDAKRLVSNGIIKEK